MGRKKWDPQARKVYLVGFEPTVKNFRLYDPNGKKIFLSCDVRFNEAQSKSFLIQSDIDSEVEEIVLEENASKN